VIQCSDSAGNEKDNIDTDSNDSGVKTEIEWAEDAQLAELAQMVPSKVSEAMLIEVCQQFKLFLFRLKTEKLFL
jgi:hypothetical protein